MKISLVELLVVFLVAFVFIGPDKMPEYTRKGLQLLKKFRSYTSKLTEEMNGAIADPLQEAVSPITELADEIKKPLEDVKKEIVDSIK